MLGLNGNIYFFTLWLFIVGLSIVRLSIVVAKNNFIIPAFILEVEKSITILFTYLLPSYHSLTQFSSIIYDLSTNKLQLSHKILHAKTQKMRSPKTPHLSINGIQNYKSVITDLIIFLPSKHTYCYQVFTIKRFYITLFCIQSLCDWIRPCILRPSTSLSSCNFNH